MVEGQKRNLALKIIITIIIVGIIVAIAVLKGAADKPASDPAPISTSQASEKSTNINSPDFDLVATEIDLKTLKSYGLPILIDFGSDECIPCKEMAPVLQKMNKEWRGKVIVKFVDVWKNPDASTDFPVSLIPTQIIFDAKGNPFVPSEKLKNEILFNLYSLKDTGEHVFTTHEGGLTEEQFRTIFAEMGVK